MNISELCYELYKIDWLRRISPERQSDAMKDYYEGLEVHDDSKEYTFNDYLEEFGYEGELYVCYEEFIETEYQDADFIKRLLNNDILYKKYLNDCGLE